MKMKFLRFVTSLFVLCSASGEAAEAQLPGRVPPVPRPATAVQCRQLRSLGMKTVTFAPGRTMKLWFPTSGRERSEKIEGDLKSSIVKNGPQLGCNLPLVIFSHGYRGCSGQSLFIVETLARAGYIVAAPDHLDAGCKNGTPAEETDPSFRDPEAWTAETHLDRRDDVKAVLDLLLSSSYPKFVNPDRIGVMGHSLGGYTGLALSGAWDSWLDTRIKAAVLLSPYSQPFLINSTLSNLQVPTMYQGGTLDFGTTPAVKKAGGAYDSSPAPKYFIELKKASHFAWTNSICKGTRSTADCLRRSANASLIVSYARGFLDEFVLGKKSRVLNTKNRNLADYRKQLQ